MEVYLRYPFDLFIRETNGAIQGRALQYIFYVVQGSASVPESGLIEKKGGLEKNNERTNERMNG